MRAISSLVARNMFSAAIAALVAVMAAEPAYAQAGRTSALSKRGEVHVEAMTLTNLREYAGRELSVLFVSARERGIGRTGQTLKVRSLMREPVKVRIDSRGVAQIPATDVPFRHSVDGVSLAFNFILFAVHRENQDDVYLQRDMDGSYARDPRLRGETGYDTVHPSQLGAEELRYMSLLKQMRMVRQKSGSGPVTADFRTDCN